MGAGDRHERIRWEARGLWAPEDVEGEDHPASSTVLKQNEDRVLQITQAMRLR